MSTRPSVSARPGRFVIIACVVSSVAVALTREPVTWGLWVLIWALTFTFSGVARGSAPFYFWLSASLFYPAVSERFTSINEFATVAGASLAVLGVGAAVQWTWLARRQAWAALALAAWLVIGLIVYVPVLAGWMWHLRGGPPPAWFPAVAVTTSALKVAIPVLFAGAPTLAALQVIRSEESARRFLLFLLVCALGLTSLAMLQAMTGGFAAHWIPTSYPMLPGRLRGVSVPDPNGFARQLLLPTLMLGAMAAMARALLPRRLLVAALIASLVAIALTLSRTTALALAAGVAILVVSSRRPRRALLWASCAAAVCALVVAAVVLANGISPDRLTLTHVTDRIYLQKALWHLSLQHPFVGVRPGSYAAALESAHLKLIGTHQMWLGVAVEWGWPMAMLLTTALVGAMAAALTGIRRLRDVPASTPGWREARAMLAGAGAVAVAYAVQGIAEVVPPESVFLVFGIALAARWRLVPIVRERARLAAASLDAPASDDIEARLDRVDRQTRGGVHR